MLSPCTLKNAFIFKSQSFSPDFLFVSKAFADPYHCWIPVHEGAFQQYQRTVSPLKGRILIPATPVFPQRNEGGT